MAQLGRYIPHEHGEIRREAVLNIIRSVVAFDGDEHAQKIKRKLLDTLIWAYTEADGKHNTRQRSMSASQLVMPDTKSLKSALVHEHMTCKEEFVARLMESRPSEIDGVMRDAKACLVTRQEHVRLTSDDRKAKRERSRRTAEERYRVAAIDFAP